MAQPTSWMDMLPKNQFNSMPAGNPGPNGTTYQYDPSAVQGKPAPNQNDPSNGNFTELGNAGGAPPQYPGPTLPGQPNYSDTFKNQLSTAKDYLGNMKAKSDQLYGDYAAQSRTSLAKGIRDVKNDFNSRGLLGSGLQSDKTGQVYNAANTDLANARSGINQGLISNQAQLEGNAFNTASIMAQPGADTANPYLSGVQSNLGNMISDNALAQQMYGQAAGGLGSLGGSALAQLMSGNPRSQYDPLANLQR